MPGARASQRMPDPLGLSSRFVSDGLQPTGMVRAETVVPGGDTHRVFVREIWLRFDEPMGDLCAHLIMFNSLEPVQRLDFAGTQQIPSWIALGEDLRHRSG